MRNVSARNYSAAQVRAMTDLPESEAEIQKSVQLAISENGAVAFRNNSGTAWVGEITRFPNGDLVIKRPRVLHAGLCTGSSDLIGYHSIIVTPDMIGSKVAIFMAIECKTLRGRLSPKQKNFLGRVSDAGGIAFVAKSAADVCRGILEWIKRKSSKNSEQHSTTRE